MAHMTHPRNQLFSGFYFWRTVPTRYTVTLEILTDQTNEDRAIDLMKDALSEISSDREVGIERIEVDVNPHHDEFEATVNLSVSLIAQGFDEAASFVYTALNPYSMIMPDLTKVELGDGREDVILDPHLKRFTEN